MPSKSFRANHVGERFLIDVRQERLRLTFLAEIRKKQKETREKRLGIEDRFGVVRHRICQASVARLVTASFLVLYFTTVRELFCTDLARAAPYCGLRPGDSPRGRSGPQEIPAPFIGNRFVPRVSARPDAWFGLPPLSDQASQSSSTQGARLGSSSRSRHRHLRENAERYWFGDRAPQDARKQAHECKMAQDIEGLHAWGKVAKVSETRRTVYPLALISESE